MKSDFLIAITQLSAEKNLPKEVVLQAVEAALVSAYRKDSFAPNQNISVKISPNTGAVKVWAEKTIVAKPSDVRTEIALEEARQIKLDVQIGDTIEVEDTPHNAGRIAAQTAKQVILQRLHEAEHSAIFEEYVGREGDIVTGVVQRVELKQVFVDLGRVEAIMPASEQAANERYRVGQRLKVYLQEVARTARGPRIVVSRSHPDLIRRLFESEVPEVFNGLVEIKFIAREAGFRSKVAVAAKQEGIDPVGCCVGLRGIRIQNVVNELGGEKIDVIQWDAEPTVFITHALSPAQVLNVRLDGKEGTATVIVPDKQLSLAIGKEGQNVRLAAKLTGCRIDIKSASEAEVEMTKALAEKEARALAAEPVPEEVAVLEPALMLPETELQAVTEAEEVAAVAEAEPTPEVPVMPPIFAEPVTTAERRPIRFAEDILTHVSAKPDTKAKKKKKKVRETAEEGVRPKKRRQALTTAEAAEYDED